MIVPAAGYTIGIEEEFQIIDPTSRELVPGVHHILPQIDLPAAQVQAEIYQSMIETATPICHSLADARRELARLRRTVIAAADSHGVFAASSSADRACGIRKTLSRPSDLYRSR